jgi:transcriptional regulator with XRE-family HTH domain
VAGTQGKTPRYLKLIGRIAGNLERLRKQRGWTLEETAERLKSDIRWYQRLESGKHSMSLESLDRLAQCFRVDVREFFR